MNCYRVCFDCNPACDADVWTVSGVPANDVPCEGHASVICIIVRDNRMTSSIRPHQYLDDPLGQ